MAKRKTPKADKVVDLKPRAERISNEQLQKAQGLINAVNRAQMDLGILETRKHGLLHDVATVQDQLTVMQGTFEKEYGTANINIQDGTINYEEDAETDKKD